MEELCFHLLQYGNNVWDRKAYHPPPQRGDLTYVFDNNGGITMRSNTKRRYNKQVQVGELAVAATSSESIQQQHHRFITNKRKFVWMAHHSLVQETPGRCKWEDCPGKKRKLTNRGRDVVKPFTTRMKCIECTF